MVEDFSLLIKKIHKANKEVEDELKNQTTVIKGLDKNVDKTQSKLNKTNGKLDRYLTKTSNGCLCGFIAAEIIIVVLLLISL